MIRHYISRFRTMLTMSVLLVGTPAALYFVYSNGYACSPIKGFNEWAKGVSGEACWPCIPDPCDGQCPAPGDAGCICCGNCTES